MVLGKSQFLTCRRKGGCANAYHSSAPNLHSVGSQLRVLFVEGRSLCFYGICLEVSVCLHFRFYRTTLGNIERLKL